MSEARPFVSVVVPTHRRPASLSRCLESLLALDYPADRIEVLVVHNWSDDGTPKVVEDLGARAPFPVTYVRRDGRGPAPSRHYGGVAARGTFVAFIDDDCQATPSWLSAAVAAFAPGVGFVQGATLPNPGHRRHFLEKTVNVPGPSPWFETCNIVYRREAFLAVGGFEGAFADRFYGEDTDLARRVIRAGYAPGFSAQAVVHHDVTSQSLARWLLECWHLRSIPLLAREWPELREAFYLRVFLSRQSAAFDLGLLGVLAAPLVGGWSLLLVLPFFFVRLLEPGRFGNPALVAVRSLLGLPRACVTFAALALGSLRHRSLVL
ncbi:MAG: glycosyltransferase family A protein [Amaricoccus sp.]|mgnify:CR=1 FL=1